MVDTPLLSTVGRRVANSCSCLAKPSVRLKLTIDGKTSTDSKQALQSNGQASTRLCLREDLGVIALTSEEMGHDKTIEISCQKLEVSSQKTMFVCWWQEVLTLLHSAQTQPLFYPSFSKA